MRPIDPYCERSPSDIPEYVEAAKEDDVTPDQYVVDNEGTFNPKSGHFACTDCYIRLGMPSSANGWVAP